MEHNSGIAPKHVCTSSDEVSPYLRKTPEDVRKAVERTKADFEKSGYKTFEEYARSLRK